MNGELLTVDSNLLFHALDGRAPEKQNRAMLVLELLVKSQGVVVLQSLGELCNSTWRKRPDLSQEVTVFVSRIRRAFPIVHALPEDIVSALEARRLHGLQFWDAMLWATARRSGCSKLLSEDMQDGRVLEGVRFLNPFAMSESDLKQLFN